MFDDETPVAWTAVRSGEKVVAADGADIGEVEKVVGDAADDIFHSLVVKRAEDGRRVEVPASRVKKMTERHIVTDLDAIQAGALPAYQGR